MSAASRLVFFGDSICVGQGISIHKSWVSKIAARVEELALGARREIVVVNASVNGNTTRQALERMPYDVQSHGVDVMVVQFGMNDCNYWLSDRGGPRVSPRAFAANLAEIIDRGVRFGARHVLLNTNHPTTRDREPMGGTDVTYEESNRRYSGIIREVAAEYTDGRVRLMDVAQCFAEHVGAGRDRLADLLLADGLHLSEKGHGLYFDLIRPVLDGILGDLLAQDGG